MGRSKMQQNKIIGTAENVVKCLGHPMKNQANYQGFVLRNTEKHKPDDKSEIESIKKLIEVAEKEDYYPKDGETPKSYEYIDKNIGIFVQYSVCTTRMIWYKDEPVLWAENLLFGQNHIYNYVEGEWEKYLQEIWRNYKNSKKGTSEAEKSDKPKETAAEPAISQQAN